MMSRLFVEPSVFHAPAVVDAIDHDREALDIGLPAGPRTGIKDDRPGAVLGQFAFDLPDQVAPECRQRRARSCAAAVRCGWRGVLISAPQQPHGYPCRRGTALQL